MKLASHLKLGQFFKTRIINKFSKKLSLKVSYTSFLIGGSTVITVKIKCDEI